MSEFPFGGNPHVLADFLKTITYKPDTWIDVEVDEHGTVHWTLMMYLPEVDPTKGPHKAAVYNRATFPLIESKHLTHKAVLDRLWSITRELEIHEQKEWFKVGGRCYKEPHNPDGSFNESR